MESGVGTPARDVDAGCEVYLQRRSAVRNDVIPRSSRLEHDAGAGIEAVAEQLIEEPEALGADGLGLGEPGDEIRPASAGVADGGQLARSSGS